MADELIIEGLRITLGGGLSPVVVDLSVEAGFGVPGQGDIGLSIEELCRDIERLGAGGQSISLQATATRMIDGLLEHFPLIAGIELTLRLLEPQLPAIEVDAIGVRKRRRRPAPPQRLPRRVIKPLPR